MNLAKEKKTKIAVFYIIISQQYGTLQILNDPLSSLFQSILANILGSEFKLCAFHLTFWDFSVGPGYMLVEFFKVKLEEIFWTDRWSPLSLILPQGIRHFCIWDHSLKLQCLMCAAHSIQDDQRKLYLSTRFFPGTTFISWLNWQKFTDFFYLAATKQKLKPAVIVW